jgi:hypothetical protein
LVADTSKKLKFSVARPLLTLEESIVWQQTSYIFSIAYPLGLNPASVSGALPLARIIADADSPVTGDA